MVTGVEQAHDGVLGRHPAGEGEPEVGPLQQGQMGLEAGPARIARTGVLEAAVHAHARPAAKVDER